MKNNVIVNRIGRPLLQTIIIIAVGTLMCVVFTALNPPVFSITNISSVMERISITQQRAEYWWRFMLSMLCLGIIPFVTGKLVGLTAKEMGLSYGASFMKKPLFLVALPLAFVIGAIGGASPELGSYYPYAKDLVEIVKQEGIVHLLGHLFAYFFLYYLPWEFFFRGFMLFPFVLAATQIQSSVPKESSAFQGASMMLACAILFQTIPSTMLHFGHPFSELLSAIPAGMIFGYIAYASRSIVPALLLHAFIGFGTDTYIVLSSLGVL
jgi:membrane protease YdiL (CAAX protease family)